MKGLYEIVDAIQWHEGMLLAPQHFQQQALRQEQLLHYAMYSIAPFSWGVLHLAIDKVRLADGQFCISELEAIMPDGLMVAHQETAAELSLDLKPWLEKIKRQNLIIYLRVPSYNPEFLEGEQRYQSIEGQPVKDTNTGEGEMSIPRLKPQLSLSIGEEPPKNRFTFFPLAQVTYKNETFDKTDFIPPLLRVDMYSELGSLITSVIARAREKAAFLSEQLRSSQSIQMNQAMSFNTQNILQGLGTSLPQLEAMLSIKVSHPYPLYLGLCALAGSIATFTSAMVPPVFEAYNHDDLRASFVPVCDFIKEILDRIRESYIAIPFDYQNRHGTLKSLELEWLKDRDYFVLRIESQHLLREKDQSYFVVGLRNPEGHSKMADLVKWGESCLIGSDTKVDSMHVRRIYGATREHIGKKEEKLSLTAPPEVELFRIMVNPESIEIGEAVIIVNELKDMYCPSDILLYTEPPAR